MLNSFWKWTLGFLVLANLAATLPNLFVMFSGSVLLDSAQVQPEQGKAYKADLSGSEHRGALLETRLTSWNLHASQHIRLFENGRILHDPSYALRLIREEGQGRYALWGPLLVFAASDNSDPRTNQRQYRLEFPLFVTSETQTVLLFALGGALCLWLWRMGPAGRCLAADRLRAVTAWFRQEPAGRRCVHAMLAAACLGMGAAINWAVFEESGFLPCLAPDTPSYLEWVVQRTPGYPLFLRAVLAAFPDFRWVVPVQLNVYLGSAVFLGLAMGLLFRSTIVGLIVITSLFVTTPMLLFACDVMSESLFISMTVIHLGSALWLIRTRSIPAAAALGITAALAVAIRPSGYPLLAGIPLAVLFCRGQRWRIGAWGLGGLALVLAGTMGAQYAKHGVMSTQSFGGYSLIGYVAPAVTEDMPSEYPELTRLLALRLRPVLEGLDQPMSRYEYWIKTTNSFNPALWSTISPAIYEYLQRTRPDLDYNGRMVTGNDIAMSIARSAILNRPEWYLGHVAVHYRTMWGLVSVDRTWIWSNYQLSRKRALSMIEEYPPLASILSAEWYEERMRKPYVPWKPAQWIQEFWEWLPFVNPWAVKGVFVLSLLAIIGLSTPLRHLPQFQGIVYAAVQLHAYVVFMVLVQPAILRYAEPMLPFLIVEFVGGVALAVAYGYRRMFSSTDTLLPHASRLDPDARIQG